MASDGEGWAGVCMNGMQKGATERMQHDYQSAM